MAEKQHFVQIVDMATGAIERITSLTEINALSAEEKLALSKNKSLYVVTHRLEPIVKVELKRHVINSPMEFTAPKEEASPELEAAPKPSRKKK